ncbi:MAG TPA: hypothetical protein VHX15_08370 [Frankiaceae bacterium]|nr:hypothetical protein [Frankiaceae bacterium]
MALQISGIRTIGVPVVDQDKALEFYVGTLGFEVGPPMFTFSDPDGNGFELVQ